MPVLWGLDHSTRLVVITVKGVIRLKDMEDCVADIMMPATLSYRKLVDMTKGSPALSREDTVALRERVREHAGGRAMSALAVVAASDESHRQARVFKSLSVADRPMRIFREIQAARDWLGAQQTYAPRLFPGEWPPDLADEAPGAH